MACVRLDISILDLPDDAGPWKGMSYQEIVDAQAAQVEVWHARLEAEIEQRSPPCPTGGGDCRMTRRATLKIIRDSLYRN